VPIDETQRGQDEYRLGEKVDIAIRRLLIQERLLIEQMEGVFPERENDLQGFTRVLDIACGTGTWAVQVARENPQIEVIGIERPRQLVHYATKLAAAGGVQNASFALLADETTRFPFPDKHFDLVNAHFLFTLLRAEEWPGFVRECLRMTRPGGYLRLIEPEWGMTDSPAFERFKSLFVRGLKRRGHSLSPDDRQTGATSPLRSFLAQAGATEIRQRFSVYTYWTEPQRPCNLDRWVDVIAQSVKPLLLSQEGITQTDFDQLMQLVTKEVTRADFSEIAYVLSVCGRKPEHVCEEAASSKSTDEACSWSSRRKSKAEALLEEAGRDH
jgi:ubiquinone/menaquinone biosynthesis C-methylase UbiE